MYYNHALVFTPEGWMQGGFRVENGRFAELIPGYSGEGVDLDGARVIPGLVDIHTHGNSGADFSDGKPEGLQKMAHYLALHGITSFLPTSMTLPYDTLAEAFQTAALLHAHREQNCARILGIHMEGPFFSEAKKGAQNSAFLKLPDYDSFIKLYHDCGGLIRIVDLAPELAGAAAFTEKASKLCKVSVAHTDADYEQAAAVFNAGASHLTHLYNAMPGVHHRRPGVIGAASERENVVAELICDGMHVHESAVRMAFRLFPERICLISDAARCCGMPDGEYELGGQQTFLTDGVARLADGTIAGAASNLYEDLKTAIRFGIPEDTAIRAATIIPAKEAGADAQAGSIEVGKWADFLVCDEAWNLKMVCIEGSRIA